MHKLKFNKTPVTQEHAMGCGLACIAYLSGKSYRQVLQKVSIKQHAWTRGFYCGELVKILKHFALTYEWKKVSLSFDIDSCPVGSIVFVKPNLQYPLGHFMVKVQSRKFMNPWKNFPTMTPAKSGFTSNLDKISYIIFPVID